MNKFKVTNTFHITGRGFVVCGTIESGVFHINDKITIFRNDKAITQGRIAGIEMLNYSSRQPERTDSIAFLLKDYCDIEILPDDVMVVDE